MEKNEKSLIKLFGEEGTGTQKGDAKTDGMQLFREVWTSFRSSSQPATPLAVL